MKNLILIIVLLLTFGFYSCEYQIVKDQNVDKYSTEFEIRGRHLQVYVIDSCEYIGAIYGGTEQ